MMDTLCLGLNAWVLADSPAITLRADTESRFGILFIPVDIRLAGDGIKSLVHIRDEMYGITAEVLQADVGRWIIDCGIELMSDTTKPPAEITAGNFITGKAFLTPDRTSWWVEESVLPLSPVGVYRWYISRIVARTALVKQVVDEAGVVSYVADDSTIAYEPINSTDDPVRPSATLTYLLYCDLLE